MVPDPRREPIPRHIQIFSQLMQLLRRWKSFRKILWIVRFSMPLSLTQRVHRLWTSIDYCTYTSVHTLTGGGARCQSLVALRPSWNSATPQLLQTRCGISTTENCYFDIRTLFKSGHIHPARRLTNNLRLFSEIMGNHRAILCCGHILWMCVTFVIQYLN